MMVFSAAYCDGAAVLVSKPFDYGVKALVNDYRHFIEHPIDATCSLGPTPV